MAASKSLVIRTISLKKLKPWSRNPRRIDDSALAGLRASIETFGLVEPVIWNERTGHVVGGHQRLKVLQAQGAEETDVVVVDLPQERETALNLALNNPAIAGVFTEDATALIAELRETEPELVEALRLGEIASPMEALTKGDNETQNAERMTFKIVVECDSEEHQKDLLLRFELEGLKCQLLIL
jgi:ParB-like chromosome segregation protein Spo0J